MRLRQSACGANVVYVTPVGAGHALFHVVPLPVWRS